MPVARLGWILAASALFLPGCFSEPKSELPPGCSPGQHLCPCNDGECDPGLTCNPQIEFCVAIDCEIGALECPCSSEGACNPTLECNEYKYCVPADGTASTAGTESDSDSVGTMSASMSAGVTSESDSDATTNSSTSPVDTSVTDTTTDSDSTPTDPDSSDSNPSTSDPSDSDPSDSDPTRAESSSSTDDPSMTTAMTDSDSDSDSGTSTTGIDPDPSISSTAVVTETESDSLESTDVTTMSTTMTTSTTDAETGGSPDCQQCVEDAQSGACSAEWDACEMAAMMGSPACMMNISSQITCMQMNGGSDDACLCFGINDPPYVQFTMCLSANCANECSCY